MMTKRNSFSIFLVILIVFIAIANWFANIFYLYWLIWWFDLVMHFLGGLWVGASGLLIFSSIKKKRGSQAPVDMKLAFTVALACAIVIGGGWEVFEFSLDRLLIAELQSGIADTASDLLMDFIGSIAGAYFFLRTELIVTTPSENRS